MKEGEILCHPDIHRDMCIKVESTVKRELLKEVEAIYLGVQKSESLAQGRIMYEKVKLLLK